MSTLYLFYLQQSHIWKEKQNYLHSFNYHVGLYSVQTEMHIK